MIYGLVEKKMELRSDEIPLNKKTRKGFFRALGNGDLLKSVRFTGVEYVEEPTDTRPFRLVVNLEKTSKTSGETEESQVGTLNFDSREEAQALASTMNHPWTLTRANRTIEAVDEIHLRAGVYGAGGAVVAAAAITAIYS